MIDGAIARLRAMRRGKDAAQAYQHGLRVEAHERHKAEWSTLDTQFGDPPITVYHRQWAYLPMADIQVWLVNGEVVRDLYKTDFIEGGNSAVYPWIPKGEIWIESGIMPQEIPLIVLHEYVECLLMARGLSYDVAHAHASDVEYRHRITMFTADEAVKLTSDILNQEGF